MVVDGSMVTPALPVAWLTASITGFRAAVTWSAVLPSVWVSVSVGSLSSSVLVLTLMLATPPWPRALGRPPLMSALVNEQARLVSRIVPSGSGSFGTAHFCWPLVGSAAELLSELRATLVI